MVTKWYFKCYTFVQLSRDATAYFLHGNCTYKFPRRAWAAEVTRVLSLSNLRAGVGSQVSTLCNDMA